MTEYKTKFDGLTFISKTAREAQACARELLENRENILVAFADAANGDHWEYRKGDNGKIIRDKRPGNLL